MKLWLMRFVILSALATPCAVQAAELPDEMFSIKTAPGPMVTTNSPGQRSSSMRTLDVTIMKKQFVKTFDDIGDIIIPELPKVIQIELTTLDGSRIGFEGGNAANVEIIHGAPGDYAVAFMRIKLLTQVTGPVKMKAFLLVSSKIGMPCSVGPDGVIDCPQGLTNNLVASAIITLPNAPQVRTAKPL